MKIRLIYFCNVIAIIILGIFSRKIAGIPLIVGDVLYAMMIYFLMRFFFISKSKIFNAVLSLTFCATIELLQLYQAEWIINIRKTTFGHYVLGEGFLWSDLLAYVVGVVLGYFVDRLLFKSNES